jgi:hypothetical protein
MGDVSGKPAVYAMERRARLVSNIGPTQCNLAKRNKNRVDSVACHSISASGPQSISPEERWQAIAVMAYHLARTRGFVGDAVKYWLAAEAKVDAELTIR